MSKREKYLEAMDRVERWERMAEDRLRAKVLPAFNVGEYAGLIHNRMIQYESTGTGCTPEAYRLGKYYNWRQQQIWDTSRRLKDAFYRRYLKTLSNGNLLHSSEDREMLAFAPNED